MKPISRFIFSVAILLLFVSCQTKTRRNYILLVDNSKTISEREWKMYVEVISTDIVPNLNKGDRLTIQFIDECVLSRAERVYNLELDKQEFTHPGDGLNNKSDSIKARLQHFLLHVAVPDLLVTIKQKRIERRDCQDYTDIINAINSIIPLITKETNHHSTIDQLINSAKGVESYNYANVLIIFSDMIQESRDKVLDLKNLVYLKDKKILQKLEEIYMLEKIPELEQCKILVFGATSSLKNSLEANRQVENLKFFWQNWFYKSGASLNAYSYDCRKEIRTLITN
jgi:hypothetical protein